MSAKGDFFDSVQAITERFLTRRAAVRRVKRERQKAKNPVVDWIEAFLWAAGVVLLVNQYLFQAYQIPSGSMIDTLLISDRIFVDKLSYGPELLPGVAKLPGFAKPHRGQVIIFENPSYISKGTLFDIGQRVLYMLTLSMVDIDRDENGQPRAHFLIKRAVGVGGDRVRVDRGEISYLFPGEDRWVTERSYKASAGAAYPVNRLIEQDQYDALEAAARVTAFRDLSLQPSAAELRAAQAASAIRYPDQIGYERVRLEVLSSAFPQERRYAETLAKHRMGWLVPEGRIFPMGDNRDNSRDARYFGPVEVKKVLGRAMFIYWPLTRIRPIR